MPEKVGQLRLLNFGIISAAPKNAWVNSTSGFRSASPKVYQESCVIVDAMAVEISKKLSIRFENWTLDYCINSFPLRLKRS